MKAAVFHGPNTPLTIEDVDIAKPLGREVLVRTAASGICHSEQPLRSHVRCTKSAGSPPLSPRPARLRAEE